MSLAKHDLRKAVLFCHHILREITFDDINFKISKSQTNDQNFSSNEHG